MYAGAAWAMAFGWADFFTVFIGAIVIGVAIGLLCSWVNKKWL